MGPSTFEMEMDAEVLGNLAFARMTQLMDEGLSQSSPESADIDEAELLLQFKRAIANKSDFLLIRLRHKS